MLPIAVCFIAFVMKYSSLEYNSDSFLSYSRSSRSTGSSLHALIHPSCSPPYLSIHGGSTGPSAPSWASPTRAATTRAATTRHRTPSCPASTAGWWRSYSVRSGCSSSWCQAAKSAAGEWLLSFSNLNMFHIFHFFMQ